MVVGPPDDAAALARPPCRSCRAAVPVDRGVRPARRTACSPTPSPGASAGSTSRSASIPRLPQWLAPDDRTDGAASCSTRPSPTPRCGPARRGSRAGPASATMTAGCRLSPPTPPRRRASGSSPRSPRVPELRGHGLGRRITGWMLDRLVEREGQAALWHYGGNVAAARALRRAGHALAADGRRPTDRLTAHSRRACTTAGRAYGGRPSADVAAGRRRVGVEGPGARSTTVLGAGPVVRRGSTSYALSSSRARPSSGAASTLTS